VPPGTHETWSTAASVVEAKSAGKVTELHMSPPSAVYNATGALSGPFPNSAQSDGVVHASASAELNEEGS
jgi:hypothetical protein